MLHIQCFLLLWGWSEFACHSHFTAYHVKWGIWHSIFRFPEVIITYHNIFDMTYSNKAFQPTFYVLCHFTLEYCMSSSTQKYHTYHFCSHSTADTPVLSQTYCQHQMGCRLHKQRSNTGLACCCSTTYTKSSCMDLILVQLYNGLKQNIDPINATYSTSKQNMVSYLGTSKTHFKILHDQ